MEPAQKIAIGIKLGHSNSSVAAWRKGHAEIIPNNEGNKTTPSYLAITDSDFLIGEAAKNQALKNPQNTIFDFISLLGLKYGDTYVQNNIKTWPFAVELGKDDKPLYAIQHKGEKKLFTSEELTAKLILRLKGDAEKHLGEPVSNAIITVPSGLDDLQREAIKKAGTAAGLNVLKLINETIAACYPCKNNRTSSKEKNIFVFHVGSRRLDVSIITTEDENCEIVANDTELNLGGNKFDSELTRYFISSIKEEAQIDLELNSVALQRLKLECERVKKILSSKLTATLILDNLAEGLNFVKEITRKKFEELCIADFRACISLAEKVIKVSGKSKSEIDEILLVGGSTNIPKLQELLSGFFGGKELKVAINPQEILAYGAAVFAGAIIDPKPELETIIWLGDMNVIPLGIETAGGNMSVIIPKYIIIPAKISRVFTTDSDDQPKVVIQIYEGERPKTKYNLLLAKFVLEGLTLAPKGVPQIEVTFEIDSNGIVKVTATDKDSGNSQSVTIFNDHKTRLSLEEIEAIQNEAEKYRYEDEDVWKSNQHNTAIEG